MPTAIVYCRAATTENSGTSLDSQEAACRAYAEAHGYTVARVTREVAPGIGDRPALRQALAALRARDVDTLICASPDRLTRNTQELAAYRVSGLPLLFVTPTA